MKKPKLFFNWSSGKDSSMALYYLLKSNKYAVEKLFTSVSLEHKRVSMHGLHEKLLQKQAEAIGIPLEIMYLPQSSEMGVYNKMMHSKLSEFKEQAFNHTAFGDIFLEDLRQYREEQLNQLNIKAEFPLWKKDTRLLIEEFIRLGFKTVVVSANAKWFDESFVGREIDEKWLADLPADVDPCGENGEFHTFCYDGPIFEQAVSFSLGEKVAKTYPQPNSEVEKVKFWYCDLLP